jgi:hypothetical protein
VSRAPHNRGPLRRGDQSHVPPPIDQMRDATYELTVVGSVGRAVGDFVVEARAAGENVIGHAAVATVDNHCTRIVCTLIVTARAAVAYVSFAVVITVLLEWVEDIGTVIGIIRNAITVGIRKRRQVRWQQTEAYRKAEGGDKPAHLGHSLRGFEPGTRTVALVARKIPNPREEVA